MPHRRLHNALTPLLVAALTGLVFAQPRGVLTPESIDAFRLPLHSLSIPLDDGKAIAVTIASSGDRRAIDRLSDTATRTVRVLSDWLGAPAASTLTIVDLPWGVEAPGASRPGVAATRVRWIEPADDLTAERSLVAALARQFWSGDGGADDGPFREGLTLYTSTRAIHRVLEGRNFEAPRYFGGFVPMPLGSLVLSPNLVGAGAPVGEFDELVQPAEATWRFASVAEGSPARRAATALRTLERMIGWPAMQQVLAELRARAATGPITPEMFATVAAEQRGVSLGWFARDLVRSSDAIDYAVGNVTSDQSGGAVLTRVRVDRHGPGVFSGTDQPRSNAPARSVTVVVRFVDGTEVRAYVDGRDQQTEFTVDSRSAAMAVAVDPDEIVLMDADRSNNVWVLQAPRNRLGLRLVANWVIWLQNVMLTCTALA